jgi:hypothetical protein
MTWRTCTTCGTPCYRTARCPACARPADTPGWRRHTTDSYDRVAAEVVALAYLNPSTLCVRCNEPARDHDRWTADHIDHGDPTSPLAASHATCNARHGADTAGHAEAQRWM